MPPTLESLLIDDKLFFFNFIRLNLRILRFQFKRSFREISSTPGAAYSSGASFRTLVANKGEHETRVTGDEARGTTGRRKKRGSLAREFPS